MDKDNRNLLLQDLSPRIPYGVKVAVNQSELRNYDYKWKSWSFDEEPQEIDGVSIYGVTFGSMDMSDGVIGFEYIKPYLFPLSSMTEEQKKEYDSIIYHNIELHCERYYDVIDVDCYEELHDFYHKNHLDYRNLIGKGLAIDATGLNIY